MPTAFIDPSASDNLWKRLGGIFSTAKAIFDMAAEALPGGLIEVADINPQTGFGTALAGLREAAFNEITGLAFAYGAGACSDSPSGVVPPSGKDRVTIARYLRAAMAQHDGHAVGATIGRSGSPSITPSYHIPFGGPRIAWDATAGAWASGSPPVVVAAAVNDQGDAVHATRPETIICTARDGTGAVFGVVSDPEFDEHSYRWMSSGSGVSLAVQTAAGNLHRNGTMEGVASGQPARFTYVSGGSTITQSTAVSHRGSASMLWSGNGSAMQEIRQAHGAVAGTPDQMAPHTTYLLVAAFRTTGAVAAGRTLSMDVCNSGGTTVFGPVSIDAQTSASGLSASQWRMRWTVFTTGSTVPSGLHSRIRSVGTALSSGENIHIDDFMLVPMARQRAGSMAITIVPGQSSVSRGDITALSVSNTRLKWHLWLDWTLGLVRSGITLPSSTTPTVSESLIT